MSSSSSHHPSAHWIEIPHIDSTTFDALQKQIHTTQTATSVSSLSAASLLSSHFSFPVDIKPPSQWNQPVASSEPSSTRAQVAWSLQGLQVVFEIHGTFVAAQDDPADKMSVLKDSRVEVFLSPCNSDDDSDAEKQQVQSYTSYEVNSAGRALDFKVTLPSDFDYKWNGSSQLLHAWTEQTAATHGEEIQFMWIQLPWKDFCDDEQVQRIQKLATVSPSTSSTDSLSSTAAPLFHLGLYRGDCLNRENGSFLWHSWIDPLTPRIAFHVPTSFGKARLLPPVQTTK